jgi:hypothetical protein
MMYVNDEPNLLHTPDAFNEIDVPDVSHVDVASYDLDVSDVFDRVWHDIIEASNINNVIDVTKVQDAT